MGGINYNSGSEIIDVIIRDSTGAKVEIRRSNILDKKANGRWLKWLIDKYNVKFEIDKKLLDFDSEFFKV